MISILLVGVVVVPVVVVDEKGGLGDFVTTGGACRAGDPSGMVGIE